MKSGMSIVDDYGTKGIITEKQDTHNVWVSYYEVGSGVYCVCKGCEEYDPLYFYIIN